MIIHLNNDIYNDHITLSRKFREKILIHKQEIEFFEQIHSSKVILTLAVFLTLALVLGLS